MCGRPRQIVSNLFHFPGKTVLNGVMTHIFLSTQLREQLSVSMASKTVHYLITKLSHATQVYEIWIPVYINYILFSFMLFWFSAKL